MEAILSSYSWIENPGQVTFSCSESTHIASRSPFATCPPMVASPDLIHRFAWQLPLNQIEATTSKCAKETLRHPLDHGLAKVFNLATLASQWQTVLIEGLYKSELCRFETILRVRPNTEGAMTMWPVFRALWCLTVSALAIAWSTPLRAQSLPLYLVLYDEDRCTGSQLLVTQPMFRLEEVGWANRARSFRLKFGAIQLVSDVDNSGLRWPSDSNPDSWYTGDGQQCVALPPWMAGRVRGVSSYGPNEQERACLRRAELIANGDLRALNDYLSTCVRAANRH